jgi:hypothetical protein
MDLHHLHTTFLELSRLSFDTTVETSSSFSPAQFNTPSFTTTGGGGKAAAVGTLSQPQTAPPSRRGWEAGACRVRTEESPGLLAKVRSVDVLY